MEQQRTFVPFDFTDTSHLKYIEDCFGGIDYMKEQFPVLYKCYHNSIHQPPKDTSHVGFIDRAHIHELTIKKDRHHIYAQGNLSLTGKSSNMHLIMEIFKDGTRISRNFTSGKNLQFTNIECSGLINGNISDQTKIQGLLTCYYTEKNVLRGGYVADTLNLEGDEYITGVVVDHPIKKIGYMPETILVSYGRGSDRVPSADYYENEKRDQAGNQLVALQMKGSVSLMGTYTFGGIESYDISMFSPEKGVILYSGSGPTTKILTNGFSWEFDKQWNDCIEESVKFGEAKYDLDIRVNFTCKDKDQNIKKQHFTVSSIPLSETKTNFKQVKPLLLLWGCIAKDGKVLYADGSRTSIQDVKIGDKLLGEGGKTATVANILYGPSDSISVVETKGGSTIRVTRDHPLLTTEGFVRAISLASGDYRLIMEDGKEDTVLNCYPMPYEDQVYSIELEEGDTFYCDGFTSGTFAMQNKRLGSDPKIPDAGESDIEYDKIREFMENGNIFQAGRKSLGILPEV